jgi:SAM-dependent methyltransferase
MTDNSWATCTEDLLAKFRGRSVAIVGNATPVVSWGEMIDRHDVVIRMNNFRTDGFEALIGHKTDYRCTSGWRDVEVRSGVPEFSPYATHLAESGNLDAFNRASGRKLLTPRIDIHQLLANTIPKPSTGCALAALCSHVGLNVDLFAFDGFRTPHYWTSSKHATTHNPDELDLILRMPGIAVYPGEDARSHYCLPAGYRPRLNPEYFEDNVAHASGTVWQPDVYPVAARLARGLGCNHVLDLGCGYGDKLVKLHPEFAVTGIDYGTNIQVCRNRHQIGRWLEVDLEQRNALPLTRQELKQTVVVCSDVIEHLVDPGALLQLLAELLRQAPVALLTTPDRNRARGPGDMGPPKNPAHVREWTLDELEACLNAEKLPLRFMGYTRSNTRTGAFATQLAIMSGTAAVSRLLPSAERGCEIELAGDRIVVRQKPGLKQKLKPHRGKRGWLSLFFGR